MNTALFDPESQDYINTHLKSDPLTLILKGRGLKGVSVEELVGQIEAKNKAEKKLSTWYNSNLIYYPNKLNIEQTSSETTAEYKAQLVLGKSMIDITGGFGVDAFYFSKYFEKVVHCEHSDSLSAIAAHNFKVLNAKNIITAASDGMEYLKSREEKFDLIYIDPSRRHENKGKVFFLKDCSPNVPEHFDLLWTRTRHILIKTGPLLDITVGMQELEFVKEIHIVAVEGEVKELLWLLEHSHKAQPEIITINIKKREVENFRFYLGEESDTGMHLSPPLSYLYEPNSAIMKSGGFNILSKKLKIKKLHQHSHLYTSEELLDFPGRCFKIIQSVGYNKKQVKALKLEKANITARNFPDSVQQIRKTHKIKDGGEIYLFFTTNHIGEKIVLVCKKI